MPRIVTHSGSLVNGSFASRHSQACTCLRQLNLRSLGLQTRPDPKMHWTEVPSIKHVPNLFSRRDKQ